MRRTWPFRHIGLKLLSVTVAVLLWMAVAGEETVERGLRVPLELQQYPVGLELLGEVPTAADVRVRGASGTLSRVAPGDIVAVLDLRGATEGERLLHLTPEQVRAPFGVEVVQVTPPTVAVAFERSATRQVPIRPAIEGKPAPGYTVGKATVNPPTVDLIGPLSAVRRVSEALTEPVSVANAQRNVEATVTVGALDPAVRVKAPRSANVTVQILPGSLEQTIRDRPVHLRNLGANLMAKAVPSEVDDTLRGAREALVRLQPDDAMAFVDLEGLGVGEYTLTVHAESSRDAGVARLEPPAIQVQITSAKN
jgi:YbbR domain-containing protein